MSNTFSGSDKIRNSKLNEGIQSLKSRIKGFDIDVSREVVKEDVTAEPKYSKIEVADSMYQLYKDRVAPTAKEDEEILVPNTQATRGNARAVARSLAGMRNGGAAGIHTHFTHQCNGDVGVHTGGYHAMVVAGTEMTLEDKEPETETIEDFKDRINGVMEACWKGYKRKPGTVEGAKGSCVKEEEIDVKDEAEQLLFEKDSEVVSELKDKLMELEDTSWQSIDKVMRVLAKEHSITPKELHKQFKSENNGMIPDDWIKENGIMEEAGFMPLDEAINLNRNGNVYEVTGMWHAHTRRIKFFVPLTGLPTRDEMQEYFEMFYPGGKLISFYPSMNPGDNTKNEIVVVVPVKEEWVQLEQQSWVEMTDEECALYEMILAEEGEPTSPPMITDDGVELWIEDHVTGEERVVVFNEGEGKKDACYSKVKSRYKVWPSAYASGALVKCRKKGAKNWGNSTKKEEVEYVSEDDMKGMTVKSGHKRSVDQGAGLTEKGAAAYRRKNPGSKLGTAVTTPPSKLKPGSKAANRRKSFCARSRGWTGERGKAARRRWNC
jgi:hypothetical protein